MTIRNGSINGRTVVNGIVLDRLDIETLLDWATELWEEGSEAKDEGDTALSASLWAKYQTIIHYVETR